MPITCFLWNYSLYGITLSHLDHRDKFLCVLSYKCLIKNENVVVRREELLSKIWGYNFFGDDRTLDTHMKLLRRKLGSYGKNIVTLRGVGYRFDK